MNGNGCKIYATVKKMKKRRRKIAHCAKSMYRYCKMYIRVNASHAERIIYQFNSQVELNDVMVSDNNV